MINMTVFDTHAEIVVHAKGTKEFQMDIALITSTFKPADCRFDAVRKAWVVTNLPAYTAVPMVAQAMESRRKQMELFSCR